MSGHFLGWVSTKQRMNCFTQGDSTVSPVRPEPANPQISSLALYHRASELLQSFVFFVCLLVCLLKCICKCLLLTSPAAYICYVYPYWIKRQTVCIQIRLFCYTLFVGEASKIFQQTPKYTTFSVVAAKGVKHVVNPSGFMSTHGGNHVDNRPI